MSQPFADYRAATCAIHATSLVDEPCHIGERTAILPFAHVMAHVHIGGDCTVGHRVTIPSSVLVGDQVRLMANTVLIPGSILERDVYCGPNTVFAAPRRMRAELSRGLSQVTPTVVRQGASIGPNATVMAGQVLGRYCLVEAGSIVDRGVPDYAVVAGDPLTIKGWRCQCGQLLSIAPVSQEAQCDHCGQHYQQIAEYTVIPKRRLNPAEDQAISA